MKVTALSIGRGLLPKLDTIGAMLKTEDIDVLGLSEVDLLPGNSAPVIPGYRVFKEETRIKVRVIAYIKEILPAVQKSACVQMPSLFLEVGQVSVGFVYNDFTQDGIKVTGSMRLQRLKEVVEEFEKSATKTAMILGD